MIENIIQRILFPWLFILSSAMLLYSPQAYSQDQLQPSAIKQIDALIQEKNSRTPAQKKIDSGLLMEIKRQRGDAIFQTLPNLQSQATIENDGSVEVDIKANVTDNLINQIVQAGGRIVNQHPKYDAIRAFIPLNKLETVAGWPEIRSVRQAAKPILNKINTSEGDVAHASNLARTVSGVTGAGVRVCALSDSVDQLATLQTSGDLPAVVDVLAGQSGNPGTSEGTAMLEIIHDLAPGANLSFATADGGEAQFAANILALHTSGCDVIVDDIFYPTEPVFQDGVIAQAVDTVSKAGALYFSSAGNSGNLNDGTSGVWEGNYVATTLPAIFSGSSYISAHDFGGGNNSNLITATAPFAVTLHWNDPQGASTNDYDLYHLDAGLTTVLGASTGFQSGTQNPFEGINGPVTAGTRLLVALFFGSPRFIHLNTIRGQLFTATDGQIAGHSAANSAIAVAAVDVADAGGSVFTGGAANPVEDFSSDGPRRISFDPNGTPLAADEIRNKPDIAAADGVATATTGFNPFFGTSAAAPHIAGIAGLIRNSFPSVSYKGINALNNVHALDIEAMGFDRDSGAGIMQADTSLEKMIFADGFESGNTSAWTN